MTDAQEPDRVLIVASDDKRPPVVELFATPRIIGWEVVEADSFEVAGTLLVQGPVDVLLVDHSVYRADLDQELMRLREGREMAAILLAGSSPTQLARALETGVQQWLPRKLALSHPELLQAALDQALRWTQLARHARQAGEAHQECRRQVHRLVSLLWEAVPVDTQTSWLTQRSILERLEEEVARATRYRLPFSVVLGEIEGGFSGALSLTRWITERIRLARRRSDILGRYGSRRFLLLLPQTGEAGAMGCCRRLKVLLEDPAHTGTARFGVAHLSSDTPTAQSLLHRAEEFLDLSRHQENNPGPDAGS